MNQVLLHSGKIYTNDGGYADGDSILINGNLIASIGNKQELIQRCAPDAFIYDLDGRTVFPGFIDSHLHLTEWARRQASYDLEPYRRLSDLLHFLKMNDRGAEWLIGYGWNANLWEEKRLPGAEDLLFLNPMQKVIFFSKDWHSAWVNDAVIDLLDPSELTKYIDKKLVDTNRLGQITGIFREEAMTKLISPLVDKLPNPFYQQPVDFYSHLYRNGLTSVHTMERFEDYKRLRRIYQYQINRGPRLGIYIYHEDAEKLYHYSMHSGDGGQWFRFLGMKFFLDGSLGSQTAWLKKPYLHRDPYCGVHYWDLELLEKELLQAQRQGIAVALHAIGDAALDAAADILSRKASVKFYPDRIEHAQLADEAIIEKLQRCNVVLSVNPSHLLTDHLTAEKHWGNRSEYAFPYRRYLDACLRIAISSDSPVESFNPWLGIMAAVTRKTEFSAEAWHPEQCISLEEAIHAYTIIPASISGEEGVKGLLLPGYFGDCFVASADPFDIKPEKWPQIESLLTVIDGKVVYQKLDG
jgi:predicted amidohydrolase YtcJ